MKMFRCRICGETYLGESKPAQCPFCGAHAELIGMPEDYEGPSINDVELTEVERADLETAIELERSNTRFYLAMASRNDNDSLRSTYKRLARIEAEHCSVFCKLAKVPKPIDLTVPGEELGSWEADIEDSLRREDRAQGLYEQFAARATNGRVREVFSAVAAVERDHIALDRLAKGYV